MATANKFNQFVEDLSDKVHHCGTDQFTVSLTNTAPVATNSVVADLTEVSYTNCSSRDLTTSTHSESSGTYTQLFADLVLTASGGSIGPFRYGVIFNNTPTSPADPLVQWYDYGSSITVLDGETFTFDFTTSTWTIA